MAKSGLSIKRDTTTKSLASIRRLMGLDVLVGVPSSKAERDDDSPLNNAQLAYIHTYGATIQVPEHEATVGRNGGKFAPVKGAASTTTHTVPAHEVNIPPRPFLEPGVMNAAPKVTQFFKRAAALAAKGEFDAARRELDKAGLVAQNEVRAVINAGIAPPLSERTLRERRARGRTGEVPLIDTGGLRNSITYVIRQK